VHAHKKLGEQARDVARKQRAAASRDFAKELRRGRRREDVSEGDSEWGTRSTLQVLLLTSTTLAPG